MARPRFKNRKTITVHMEAADFEWLNRHCDETMRDFSKLVRGLLAEYRQSVESQKSQTA